MTSLIDSRMCSTSPTILTNTSYSRLIITKGQIEMTRISVPYFETVTGVWLGLGWLRY